MSIAPVELGHNLSLKAFKWLWVKYVTTVNDKYHCTNCLRGRYGKVLSKHNSELTKTPVMLLDEFPLASFSAIYVCGVINKGYLHRSAISSLEPVLRVFEGCAKAYLGNVDDANVVKLHRFSGKVSYCSERRSEKAASILSWAAKHFR